MKLLFHGLMKSYSRALLRGDGHGFVLIRVNEVLAWYRCSIDYRQTGETVWEVSGRCDPGEIEEEFKSCGVDYAS